MQFFLQSLIQPSLSERGLCKTWFHLTICGRTGGSLNKHLWGITKQAPVGDWKCSTRDGRDKPKEAALPARESSDLPTVPPLLALPWHQGPLCPCGRAVKAQRGVAALQLSQWIAQGIRLRCHGIQVLFVSRAAECSSWAVSTESAFGFMS